MVLLPTPPLPVTKSSLRSSSAVMGWPRRWRSAVRQAPLAAEPDVAAVVGPADLDVRDLLGRDTDLASLAVGQPEHPAVGQSLGHVGLERVGVGVGRQL